MSYRYSVSPVDELKCCWWNLYYSWVSLVTGILPKLWHWYNDIFLLLLYLWAAPPFPLCIELWESQPFPHLVRGTKMKLHKLKTSKSPCFTHADSRSLTSQTLLPLWFSYKDNSTFLLYPITFKCEHTTWSKPALKLCTVWMWHTTSWLFIEVHFIFSMRQQQPINMQVSLSLHHVIQIMIL